MRTFLTALTFMGVLVFGAPVLFFVLLVLAGPHSGFLPHWAAPPATVAAAAGLLGFAMFVARKVWRRFARSASA